MSTSMNMLLKEVKDATECSICTEIFTSPKMLPCFHTFCLKCIEQYGEDRREGDILKCPMCRGEFKVPVGGLSKLRSNFCLERLISTVSSAKKQCCVTHPTKEIEFYCQGCRVSICGACLIIKHNKHDIRDIAEIAKEAKERFKIYSKDASNLVTNIRERSEILSEQLYSFTDSIEQVKTSIIRRGEDIKRMVDKQTNDLLGELDRHKALGIQNLETIQEDLQMSMVICGSFEQFCTKIIAEADHVETVSVSDELATKAAELNVMSIPELEIIYPQLKFVSSDFDITENQQNIVGKLFGECETHYTTEFVDKRLKK